MEFLYFMDFNSVYNLIRKSLNQIIKIDYSLSQLMYSLDYPFSAISKQVMHAKDPSFGIQVDSDRADQNCSDYILTPKKQICYEYPQRMEIQTSQKEYQQRSFYRQEDDLQFVPWKDSIVQVDKMEHVRINRGRLLDWYLEVCKVFNQSWRTLWAAIHILDRLIVQKGSIKVENIHLHGAASFLIASKYHETTQSITVQQMKTGVLHEKFTRRQILNCESEVFAWICLSQNNKSLHFATMVDRLMEKYPQIQDQTAKKVMVQLFFVYQEPKKAFQGHISITENQLVQEVCQAIQKQQRYGNCYEVEDYFLTHYACLGVRRYGYKMKL